MSTRDKILNCFHPRLNYSEVHVMFKLNLGQLPTRFYSKPRLNRIRFDAQIDPYYAKIWITRRLLFHAKRYPE